MKVFEFDAMIAVEAKSHRSAVRKILEHCSKGDVACSLWEVGKMPTRTRRKKSRR